MLQLFDKLALHQAWHDNDTDTHTLSLYRPWSQGYLQPWQDALITGHMNHLVGVWYCVFVLRDKER